MEKQTMERISGLVVFFLGIAILWEGRRLAVGTLGIPGPGFFPLLLGVILIILSLLQITSGKKNENEPGPFSVGYFRRVIMVLGALLVYFIFLEYLGFLIVSFFLMAFCFVWVAHQKWYSALLWAFVTIGLAHLLFDILLKSNLPMGVLGFYPWSYFITFT